MKNHQADSQKSPVIKIVDHTGTEPIAWIVGKLTHQGTPADGSEVIHAITGEAAMAAYVARHFGELPFEAVTLAQVDSPENTWVFRVFRYPRQYEFGSLGSLDKLNFLPTGDIEIAA